MESVTKSQRRVLDFIKGFIEKNRYSPSFDEIAAGVGLKSLATVSKHIGHLKEKGLLKDSRNRARSLEIVAPGTPEARFVLNAAGTHLRDNVEHCWWVRED
jgi:repressor LexA